MVTRIEGFGTTNPSKNLGILCPRSRKIDWFSIICRLKTYQNALAGFGNPLILGVKRTESLQNLAESYFFLEVSQPRTEVKKTVQNGQLVWIELTPFVSCSSGCGNQKGELVWFGARDSRCTERLLCTTFVSPACCLFSLLYNHSGIGGYGHVTDDSVDFFRSLVSVSIARFAFVCVVYFSSSHFTCLLYTSPSPRD